MSQYPIIGGTGRRDGMSQSQLVAFTEHLDSLDAIEYHHGDCVGFDEQSHRVAKYRGFWVVAHPPISDKYRAHCDADLILEPKDYLTRDHDIVQAVNYLITCPSTFEEKFRGSGTWATIRYARKAKLPHAIIFPDGRVEVKRYTV